MNILKIGALFTSGDAMKTGFGTIYSTNITPDRETGIGSWSEAAFIRAMRDPISLITSLRSVR